MYIYTQKRRHTLIHTYTHTRQLQQLRKITVSAAREIYVFICNSLDKYMFSFHSLEIFKASKALKNIEKI